MLQSYYRKFFTREAAVFSPRLKKTFGFIFLLFSVGFAVWYPLAALF
jgi:hypothetical protein